VDEYRPGCGKNGQKMAVFGKKWQNGTVWDSLAQVQNPQHPAVKEVTKNEGQKKRGMSIRTPLKTRVRKT
jgi:hypothetical protein